MANTNHKMKIFEDMEAFLTEDGLTTNIDGIYALDIALNSLQNLSSNEIIIIQELLLNSIANQEINKDTGNILKNPNKCGDINISTFVSLNLFTHCTRHYNRCPSLLELQKAVHIIMVDDHELVSSCLSVEQLGIINDLALIESFMNILEQKQIIASHPALIEFREKVRVANQINQVISINLIDQDILDQVEGGDFVKQFTKQDLLKNLVDYYVNITKLIDVPSKEINQDDHFVSQENELIDLEKRLFSNFYKIDLNQLFTKENQKILQKLYGKQWREEIASIMKEIENKIAANHIHEEHRSAQKFVKTFGAIHHNSSALDHDFLNSECHNVKYSINKDHNMLMLASQEQVMQQIIEQLEVVIVNAINDSNVLNLKDNINIIKKPLKLHLIKERFVPAIHK